MRNSIHDVIFSLRLLPKKPGFAAVVLLTLILGIGLNTAVFTLLRAIFLHPLPVTDAASLVRIYMSRENSAGEYVARVSHSHPNFLDLRQRSRSLAGLAIYQWWPMNLSGGSEPLRATGMFASANYFEVLGLEPALGRFFLPHEDETPGSHPVVVLSHSAWTRLFGADPQVLDRTVRVNGRTMTVVGVAPRGFRGTEIAAAVDFWLPAMMYPEVGILSEYFDQRGSALFAAIGRLQNGTSLRTAEGELRRLYRQIEADYPEVFKGFEGIGAVVEPLAEGIFPRRERGQNLRYGQLLAGAVGLLLVIACLTIAHLLLVRAAERRREIAVRCALGASRARVVAQLVRENLTLFLLGGALSLPFGHWFLKLLWRLRPPQFADGMVDLRLDPAGFGFALAVAAAAGLLFGLLPALQASRYDPVVHLKGSEVPPAGWRGRWLQPRRLLVVAQVALTLVALIAAGLFVRSLANAYRIDLGFDPEGLVVVTLAPGDQGYDEERSRQLYRQIEERVEALPGVDSAALSQNRLLRGSVMQRQIFLPGQDEAVVGGGNLFHRVNAVFPGFFATARIPLVTGQDFDDSIDKDSPPVAIVNQTMADLLWPGEDAIGKRFHFDFPTAPSIEVVGVARDARYRNVREEPQFFVYVPAAQFFPTAATLHVRAEGDPDSLLAALRREIRALDPALPLADTRTMAEFVADDLWRERSVTTLLGVFGLLALVLATLGVYGVLAQSVEERRREIGIRVALGAGSADVVRQVFARGAALIAAGLATGLFLAYHLLRLTAAASSELIDVEAGDPSIWALAALLLFAVALVGCLVPAVRAVGTDPLVALREE